jgi:hypothetical protein
MTIKKNNNDKRLLQKIKEEKQLKKIEEEELFREG